MGVIGLGFSGVGWLGESLIKALHREPGFRLAAVQDLDAELLAEVAARHLAPWSGTEYLDLLAAPGVDAVLIATPNAFHAAQAQAALAAGKHVLVQKPLALSLQDARATVDASTRAKRVLFVDYSYRHLETMAAFEAALPEIGRPRCLEGMFHNQWGPGKAWFFNPALSGGGALMDLGVHLLDLGLALLRPSAASLNRSDLSHGQGHAVEDAALLDLTLDAVPFRLEVSWQAPRPRTEIALRLEGEGGAVAWENVDGSFFHFRTLLNGRVLADRETTLREDTLRDFARALRGAATPCPDLRVYALLDQAYQRSARLRPFGRRKKEGRVR